MGTENSSDLITSVAMRLPCSVMGAMGTGELELVNMRLSIQNLILVKGKQHLRNAKTWSKGCKKES